MRLHLALSLRALTFSLESLLTFDSLFLYPIGFIWGWIFLPLMFLISRAVDSVHNEADQGTKVNLWFSKIVTFLALLLIVGLLYWQLLHMFLTEWFPGQGKEFGGALLIGFLSFVLLPRIERGIRSKRGKAQ